MHASAQLEEILVFLVAAVCIVPLFRWFRPSAVLGYLAADLVVEPRVTSRSGPARLETLLETSRDDSPERGRNRKP